MPCIQLYRLLYICQSGKPESGPAPWQTRPPQKHKSPSLSAEAFDITGQRPTLPHTCACSTIGAEGLNFRVRDGNGWVPLATVTQNLVTEFVRPIVRSRNHDEL